jgi:hypothetical protein
MWFERKTAELTSLCGGGGDMYNVHCVLLCSLLLFTIGGMTRLWARQSSNCGSILAGVENISLHQNIGTSYEALLVSYCIGTGDLSPG